MGIYVIFFGGYKSTQPNVDAWLASAKAQCSDVDFDAIPYPAGASYTAHSALSHFPQDQFDAVITQIGTCGADQIYIVGHSSGCAIANYVDRGLKNHDKINLVALDGFAPDGDQLGRKSTQVWSAANGDAKSLNYKYLSPALGSRLQIYPTTKCTTELALHFSVVNTAATPCEFRASARSHRNSARDPG
ncbi:MAG TPA: hypothetical protein VKV39_10435 [Candidatus Sulfotelmatobacter sp.]|nr:hypothetical protein [Candidatus Sulfotelmatobacter sp.]